MLSQTLEDALNKQIKKELESAYVYLSMSAYLEANNLPGLAAWMKGQNEEETEHAMKLFEYLNDRGGRVKLYALEQPPLEYESPLDAFQQALAHEQNVTRSIHQLYELAGQENDHPTQVMLHWFITEQVEEEKSVGDVLEMVKVASETPWHLMMLDQQVERAED